MIVAPLIMLFPFIVKESLGLTPWHVGMIQMAAGVGTVTGALSLGLLVRHTSRYIVSVLGATLPILCFVVIGLAQSYWPLLVGVGCFTVFTTWLNTLISSRLALVIPDSYRSRTSTTMSVFSGFAIPIGLLITAPLMDYFNSWHVFLGCSLLSTLSLFLFFMIPGIKDFFNQSPEQAQDWFKSIHLEKE